MTEKKDKKPHGYWTKERCFELAKHCKTTKEFKEKSKSAYVITSRKGWIKEINWFVDIVKPVGYWTDERIFEVARECKTKKEFAEKYKSACTIAYKRGLVKEMSWLINYVTPYEGGNSVYCYKDEDTKAVYVGRTFRKEERHKEHTNNAKSTVNRYFTCMDKPIPEPEYIEDNLTITESQDREDYWIKWFKKEGWTVLNKSKTGVGTGSVGAIAARKWTKNKCFELSKECKSKLEFREKHSVAYDVCKKNKWFDEMLWLEIHRRPNGYWNIKEHCMEIAKHCKTRSEFQKTNNGAYQSAIKNNWLDDMTWLDVHKKPNNYWTRELCYESAKQCTGSRDFRRKFPSAYNAAIKNGWCLDYTWFPKRTIITHLPMVSVR